MCGITGWIKWGGNLTQQQSILEDMTNALTPRGPDDKGTWLSSHAALGHRRLIVIDPEGGIQPMVRKYQGSVYVLLYNGELYNTEEVRRDLMALGHSFSSHSDTEVVLVSYLQWGEHCLKRLNGIFAFAVWNDENESLFLARDRLGVKPLFYTRKGDTFLFGSELKAILAHPDIQPQLDNEGLAEIFVIGPARTPGHGVFRGIHELKPGYYMKYNRQGIYLKQYWALESHDHPDDLDTSVSKVRELVKDSIVRQLVSDVPVCTLLSGGLDSSAITAFASAVMKEKGLAIQTYSVDYLDNDKHFKPSDFQPNSDAPWITQVSRYLGTLHHEVTIDTPQLVESLVPAVYARDLPGMADIDSSLYLFSKQIKKDATVALSGECADEVFGGYPWLRREESIHANTFPWSLQLQIRTEILSKDLIKEINPEKYLAQRYQEALDEVPRLPGETSYEQRMREIFYLNMTRWMPTLLDRKDRMSMACSLEIRVPFCDHRLVEYVWNVPVQQKFCDNREKGLLRRALKGVLPQNVLDRRKSPYPKTHNPNYYKAVREWLLNILDDSSSPVLQFLDKKKILESAKKDASASGTPWFGQLMGKSQLFAYLIQINTWLKEYNISVK